MVVQFGIAIIRAIRIATQSFSRKIRTADNASGKAGLSCSDGLATRLRPLLNRFHAVFGEPTIACHYCEFVEQCRRYDESVSRIFVYLRQCR